MYSRFHGARRRRFPAAVCFLLIFCALQNIFAQTVAFPGALGFGAYATGGRNGTVFHVTTLADTYPTVTPGSFRDAVSHSGRTIVFDVGGTITLAAAVSCSSSLTIAGQTAPGGICFNAGEIAFAGRNNDICRYIRIRPGSATSSTGDDCLSLYQATNVILDHVSLEFGPWNNIDAVTANNITVQHCIDANPIYQQFGAHTENVGAAYAWQYNLFANSHNRNPLAKINTVFVNNLEYNNSAGYTTHTSTRFKHDIVNNYFIAGPASGGNFPWYQIDKNQSIYYSGNLYDADKNGALNGTTTTPYWYQGVGTVLTAPWSSWTTVIPTMSPDLAARYDLSAAGAFPRDDIDSLVVSQVKTFGSGTTGPGVGTTGPDGGLYTSQAQTGLSNNGYGTLTGLTAATDTDGDGMPDYWELATGSNPNVANPLTNTITGYTLLENYLNFLAAPHAVTQTNTPADLNLSQFTGGFAASSTFTVSSATNGTVSILNATNAHFVPSANFSGLGSFTFTVTDGGYTLNVGVTVCVTPAVPPASATAFNGAIIGVVLASVPLPSNLTWRGDGSANNWNLTSSNWFNGSGPAAYKGGDVVSFDDTGSNTPAINLSVTTAPGSFTFDSTKNYAIAGSGSLSGSMSLSKSGAGSLTLYGPNSFTGGTTLNEGTLILSNITSLGSGALTLNGGAVSLLATGGPAIFNNPITVAAPATVLVTNSVSFNEAFGAALSGGANLDFYVGSGATFSVRSGMTMTSYSGVIALRAPGTFRWQGGTGSASAAFDLGTNGVMITRDGGTVILGSLTGGAGTFLKGAGGSSVATTYVIGGKNTSTTFAGQITNGTIAAPNTTAIIKAGTGTLTLTGTNYHTGTTSVTNGALVVNGTLTAGAVTANAAGTLAGAGTIGGLVTISAGGKFSPGNGAAGTITLGGGLTLNGGTVNLDLASLTTAGGGVNDLIALTGGTLTLNGTTTINPNLLNGPLANGSYTLISGGTATTGTSANLLWGGPAGTRQTIALDAGTPGSLLLDVSGPPAGNLVWRGTNGTSWDTTTVNWANGGGADIFYNLDTVLFDDTGSNPSGVTLTTTLAPSAIVVNSSQNYTFSGAGALFGSGSLTKLGASTLTIGTANNSFTGAINLFGGTLSAAAGSVLGGGNMTISNGATFALPSSSPSVFFGGSVTVPAGQSATISSGALGNGISGNIFSGDTNSLLNIAGGVSFSGTTPAQFDNFTGTINIQPGGTLRFSPNSSGNTFGSLNPALVINGTLQPRNAGNTVQIGAFTGSGLLAGAQAASGTGDTLYIVGGNNADSYFTGVISSNSAVAGSDCDLNKVGTGTLTLTGNSTFGGGTTVNAGTLRINNLTGTGTGTGDLEVFSGATLTGKGIIGSATTVADGATLAPGDPTGTLTISNNLTLNDNSLLPFALGTNSDALVVSGDLFLTGRLTLSAAGGFGPGTYTLFTCGGALTFDNLVLVSAPAGYNYTIDTTTPGVVKLIVALPAPPAFAGVNLTGGSLTLSGSNGTPFKNYYVLQSSNLATWTPIATNQFDVNGGFSFTTNAPAGSLQNFFRLQLP
ncbi:MAG: autotransporter-associated beta strand repeat-containing protein [Verrucomicrobiae bacterium]|nr:autotransporter-associated beta strand repeat-containing protein [Verrucomicrobiae bacterium]